jgi:hypothetical protein
VALVLAAYEISVRRAEVALSTDVRHIYELPDIADRLHASGPPRVLLLGNSLTGRGVDVEIFRGELAARGADGIACAKAAPDATTVSDWYYALKNHFAARGRAPEVVIIGFGNGHLPDDRAVDPRALGRYFCRLSDIPELFRHELFTVGQRSQFVLSYLSAGFGNQDRVKKRVLDVIIPDYRRGSRRINALNLAGEAAAEAEQNPQAEYHPTFQRLRRLMALLRRHDVRGIFVAMPKPGRWEPEPGLPEAVVDGGMTFVDCRKIRGLTRRQFPDGMHLGREGATIYSRALAARLAEPLKHIAARTRPASRPAE